MPSPIPEVVKGLELLPQAKALADNARKIIAEHNAAPAFNRRKSKSLAKGPGAFRAFCFAQADGVRGRKKTASRPSLTSPPCYVRIRARDRFCRRNREGGDSRRPLRARDF